MLSMAQNLEICHFQYTEKAYNLDGIIFLFFLGSWVVESWASLVHRKSQKNSSPIFVLKLQTRSWMSPLMTMPYLCGIFSPTILPILKENYEVTEKCDDSNQAKVGFSRILTMLFWRPVETCKNILAGICHVGIIQDDFTFDLSH